MTIIRSNFEKFTFQFTFNALNVFIKHIRILLMNQKFERESYFFLKMLYTDTINLFI